MVRITEARRGSFCRGEAVEVVRADPRRVAAPCVHFRPGGCGGCDFQHADPALQRELKAAVVAEQLRRLAGVEFPVTVEELPGGGFGWRTRVRWALDPEGRIGPRAVRSHRVQPINPVEPCLIAAPGLTELAGSLEVPAVGAPRTGRRRRARTPQATAPRRAAQRAAGGRALRRRRRLADRDLARRPRPDRDGNGVGHGLLGARRRFLAGAPRGRAGLHRGRAGGAVGRRDDRRHRLGPLRRRRSVRRGARPAGRSGRVGRRRGIGPGGGRAGGGEPRRPAAGAGPGRPGRPGGARPARAGARRGARPAPVRRRPRAVPGDRGRAPPRRSSTSPAIPRRSPGTRPRSSAPATGSAASGRSTPSRRPTTSSASPRSSPADGARRPPATARPADRANRFGVGSVSPGGSPYSLGRSRLVRQTAGTPPAGRGASDDRSARRLQPDRRDHGRRRADRRRRAHRRRRALTGGRDVPDRRRRAVAAVPGGERRGDADRARPRGDPLRAVVRHQRQPRRHRPRRSRRHRLRGPHRGQPRGPFHACTCWPPPRTN